MPLSLILGLLGSKIGRGVAYVIGAVVLVFVIYTAGNLHGRSTARAKCQEAALREQLKIAHRDLDIQRAVAAGAQKSRDEDAKRADDLAKKVASYEEHLAKRGGTGCALDDADVRRLRPIQRPR